jgi:hypothetical protein
MSRDLRFFRFLDAPAIRVLDVEAGGRYLHWASALNMTLRRPPKCPSCSVECCFGHPRNDCELRDVYDVSET